MNEILALALFGAFGLLGLAVMRLLMDIRDALYVIAEPYVEEAPSCADDELAEIRRQVLGEDRA